MDISKDIIDNETLPNCKLIEKRFEWGEPYTVLVPIFDFKTDENLKGIYLTIEIFGKNNFKNQLLRLRNKLINFEEYESIKNFEGTIKKRADLINRIDNYIRINQDIITPWEKYNECFDELDYINELERGIGEKLFYVEKG